MGSAVLFVPPYGQQSEWKKTDDLPSDVRSELEKYCLCGVEWQNKDEGTIKCSANDACEGEDCIFWTLTYVNIENMKIIQDIDVQKFGQEKPDPTKGVLHFGDDAKTYKSLKLGKNGDLTASPSSRVIFCSCGTLAAIGALRAKHAWVEPPLGDPLK